MIGSLPFSLHHYLCPPDLEFPGFLDQVRDHGFRSVALTQAALRAQPLEGILEALGERGLRISSLNSAGYFLGDGDAGREQDRRNAHLLEQTAACAGARLNVIVGGTTALPLAGARELAAHRLAEFAHRARDAGVQIVVEPMTPLNVRTASCFNTIAQIETLADRVPDLRISVDLFHVWWDPDLDRLLRGGSVPVGLLQICDVAIPSGETIQRRVPLGEGFVPWAEHVRTARTAFPGMPVELELFSGQLPGRRFEKVLASSAKALGSLVEVADGHCQDR